MQEYTDKEVLADGLSAQKQQQVFLTCQQMNVCMTM